VRVDRRGLLGLGVGAAVAPAVVRAATPATERIALWPGTPPGGPPTPVPRAFRAAAVPELIVHRAARPDGRGVLVIPGGGYGFVATGNEGAEVAAVLTRFGITAFVLSYRLPLDGWRQGAAVPRQDAQRAIRLIRERAAAYRIAPGRVAVLGFSAGGHLAGMLATSTAPAYARVDAADRHSVRPNAAGLIYAVSNMEAGRSFGGSRRNLLGPAPTPAEVARFAVDRRLAGAPPLFLLAAEDDATVPVVNTLDLAAAARRARVLLETHLFARGGHGFGVRPPPRSPASLWPELFDRWLAEMFSRTAG